MTAVPALSVHGPSPANRTERPKTNSNSCFSKIWEAVKSAFQGIKDFFSRLWNGKTQEAPYDGHISEAPDSEVDGILQRPNSFRTTYISNSESDNSQGRQRYHDSIGVVKMGRGNYLVGAQRGEITHMDSQQVLQAASIGDLPLSGRIHDGFNDSQWTTVRMWQAERRVNRAGSVSSFESDYDEGSSILPADDIPDSS